MRNSVRSLAGATPPTWFWTAPLIGLALAALVLTAQASPRSANLPPAIPATFHGTAMTNGAFVPAGTFLTAGNGTDVYASATTTIYEGSSVYRLSVPEDDPDTPALDGGHPDEVLVFRVGGLLAHQTAVWQSGVYQALNLTARDATPTVAAPTVTCSPEPSPTATPTVTETPTVTPSPTRRWLLYLPLVLR